MTVREWETFFGLLRKIVDAPAPFDDKKAEVLLQAKEHSEEINLEEFVGWFSEEDF